MKMSLTTGELKEYVKRQCEYMFPDGSGGFEGRDIDSALLIALERTELCFSKIKVRNYRTDDGQTYFSHTHSDQYSTFLYFLSNSLWSISENKTVCDKLILLNRALHGVWYSYKVKLPDIFLFVHPIGTILGHANYSNYLVVFQNVTIGEQKFANERNNELSSLGTYLLLSGGSTIIGTSHIGDNVSLGVRTTVHGENIQSGCIVYNDKISGQRIIKTIEGKGRAAVYFYDN